MLVKEIEFFCGGRSISSLREVRRIDEGRGEEQSGLATSLTSCYSTRLTTQNPEKGHSNQTPTVGMQCNAGGRPWAQKVTRVTTRAQ